MSPRSQEFMDVARARLRAARTLVDARDWEVAVTTSYYAALYAARAALSEKDRYAKTHAGTWGLLRELYVEPGVLDQEAASAVHALQKPREAVDYDAAAATREEAQSALAAAERFVQAVDEALT